MRVRIGVLAVLCLLGLFPTSQVGAAAGSPEPFTSWAAMVDAQYIDLTGVAPTSAQRSAAVSALSGGTQTPGGLVASLRTSEDHVKSVDPVTRLYRAFLLRIPDKGGLEFWIKRRRTGTWTLNRIADSFATSSEFKTRYGRLSNLNFVKLIYDNVLERPYDSSGLSFWTRQLDLKRKTRGAVMANFSESNEYKNKQAAEVNVSVLNIFMLGRAPSKADFDTAVAALEDGQTVASYAGDLIASSAYANRIAAPLVIADPTLPTLYAGVPMQTVLTATGGFGTQAWSATGLPAWVTLDAATGALSGTPPAVGVTNVTAKVTAGSGMTGTKTVALDVKAGMPAGCVTTDCAKLDTTAGTVQIPAATVTSVTRSSQTVTAVALSAAAPNVSVGNILVIAPGAQAPSGLIVKATAVSGANGAARTVTVTKSTLTDAYANGIVKGTGTPEPAVAGSSTRSTRASGCSANANIEITPEVTVGLKPNVTLLWGKNVAGFGDVFVGTGGVKLFQFDMFGDLTFRLKGSMTGSVDCTLDVPGVTIPIPVGPAGFLFFKLQPNLGLKATAGVEIDTTVTVKCGVVFAYNDGNEFRSQYCNPTYTSPKVSTASTGADLTVSGGVTTSLTFNEAIGISGNLTASVHAGYKPLAHPIGVLDGKVTANLSACLACAFGSSAPTLTIADATIWSKTFATWDTPSPPPVLPLTIKTQTLPRAVAATPYDTTVRAVRGSPPYTWTATGLPVGLSLNASTGQITGSAASPVTASVRVTVQDRTGMTASRALAFTAVARITTDAGSYTRITTDDAGDSSGITYPRTSTYGGKTRVAFAADPAVMGGTAGHSDLFVYEVESGLTVDMTNTPEWERLVGFSQDGRFLFYQRGESGFNLRVYDLATSEDISIANPTAAFINNDNSFWPSISADGKRVVYWTARVPGSPAGLLSGGYYLWDFDTRTTTLLLSDARGYQDAPSISGDGTKMGFSSDLATLPGAVGADQIYLLTLADKSIRLVGGRSTTTSYSELNSISSDGRYLLIDNGSIRQLDAVAGTGTTVAQVTWPETAGITSMDQSGRYVAYNVFPGTDTGTSRVVVYDRQNGSRTTIDPSGGRCTYGYLLDSGRALCSSLLPSGARQYSLISWASGAVSSTVAGDGLEAVTFVPSTGEAFLVSSDHGLASPDLDGTYLYYWKP